MSYSPTKIILFFFLAVILAGTLLLCFPAARVMGNDFSLLTNFFTASSAVCVTGLVVVDTGTYYSSFGQAVILFLIQVGGIGYMTLSTIAGVFIGRIALKERAVITELFDIKSFSGILPLFKKIALIILSFEAIGAVVLTLLFLPHYSLLKSVYLGIFHSVSAFCNAGFSLFPDSLESFSHNWPVLVTVALLIICGGLGFLVLIELGDLFRKRISRLSLHSRIVLLITALLIAAGLVSFWLLEANNVLKGKGFGYSLLNSFFQSVTARTAGFDSIATGLLNRVTSVMIIILMFIGASPGGTGGGIKTSTFVIVSMFVYAVLRDRETVNIWERRISEDIVHKALAILLLSFLTILIATMVLIVTEPDLLIDIFFEVVSAFGTVGLSRGITPKLTDFGKIVIAVTMIIGRIGPLTFLLALLKKQDGQRAIMFPEERVLIG